MNAHGCKSFHSSQNFMRVVFPYAGGLSRPPESLAEKVVLILKTGALLIYAIAFKPGQKEISGRLKVVSRDWLHQGMNEMTIPDKLNSHLQKYWLTEKGKNIAAIAGEE